jgi:hypothetical protein
MLRIWWPWTQANSRQIIRRISRRI